ncbi:MAG: HD domain-containing protein [Candidatus Aminicenantes bacterium]|nr:HD domain-containing protein [Candidatus Aminicenantes bacterium]
MLVEDESIVARDICNMLLGLGYDVLDVVSSASESIKKTRDLRPDLVLMDIMLEGEKAGIQAAHYIFTHLNTPVVYLTAYTDEITLQQAKKSEPFGYLLKPFEERELHTTIETALYKFQMEMKLRERERWLFTILKSIRDGVIATDQSGIITFMNPLAESLTGWTQEEAIKKHLNGVFSVIDESTKKRFNICIDKILKDVNFEFPNDLLLVSREGKKAPIEPRLSSIRDENNAASGVVIAFSDITARKEAEKELIESWEKLSNAMKGAIQAIAFTIETRDPYTAGHQLRVSKLAVAIGQELGLSDDQIEGLRLAGNIHDIGKIYVPAEILSKPGKISDIEFALIKIHSQVGYDILKNIDFPWPIAKIVLQHHERLDGSGYPAGLKGDDILLEAKILGVCDVVEAMASYRPYRPSLSISDALDEISKNNGNLYDSKIVDACLKLFKEKGFRFD